MLVLKFFRKLKNKIKMWCLNRHEEKYDEDADIADPDSDYDF